MVFSPFQIILAVMTKANPTKKREHLLKFLSKKCSLHSKCYIVFYPVNYSYCVTILQIDTKNCCQFVVNSDLGCRKPLILLGFLVQRLHCGDERERFCVVFHITVSSIIFAFCEFPKDIIPCKKVLFGYCLA